MTPIEWGLIAALIAVVGITVMGTLGGDKTVLPDYRAAILAEGGFAVRAERENLLSVALEVCRDSGAESPAACAIRYADKAERGELDDIAAKAAKAQ